MNETSMRLGVVGVGRGGGREGVNQGVRNGKAPISCGRPYPPVLYAQQYRGLTAPASIRPCCPQEIDTHPTPITLC
eukprot:767547-Hanusia_phi.AAC.1